MANALTMVYLPGPVEWPYGGKSRIRTTRKEGRWIQPAGVPTPTSIFTGRRSWRRWRTPSDFSEPSGRRGREGDVVRIVTGRGRGGGGAPIRTRVRTLLRRLSRKAP